MLRPQLTALTLLCALVGCQRHTSPPPPKTQPAAARTDTQAAPTAPVSEPAHAAADVMLAERGTITIAGRTHAPTWRLELAIDKADRSRGLMFRKRVADDAGMLFFMGHDDDWAFYMRNTYVALDMIFIDKDWQVVGVVANTRPLTETLRQVGRPSRYVLELNAHQARDNGIRPGTRMVFSRTPVAGSASSAGSASPAGASR